MFSFYWSLLLPRLYAQITHSCSPCLQSCSCCLQSLRGASSSMECLFSVVQLQLCPQRCLLPHVSPISLEVFSPFSHASSNCCSFQHRYESGHWGVPCFAAVLVQDGVFTAVSEPTKASCDWPGGAQNIPHRGQPAATVYPASLPVTPSTVFL